MDSVERRLRELMGLLPDITGNEKRLKAALKDYFPEDRRTQNMLHMAVEAGVVEDAKALRHVNRFRMHGYVKRLTDDYGISEGAARSLLGLWLRSLDIPFEQIEPAQDAQPRQGARQEEPGWQARPRDMAQDAERENQLLEEMVREYNALLHAAAGSREEQGKAFCSNYLVMRFRLKGSQAWAEPVKPMPGTADWWSICWRRSRYWALSLLTSKYAVFPNPRLVHEGRLHMATRLDEFFLVLDGQDEGGIEGRYQPAIFEESKGAWKLFSKGILYIW